MHDPCAVVYIIDPSAVSTQKVPLDVELNNDLTLGVTVEDFQAPLPDDCNTQVAVDLDHEAFWNLVIDAIQNLDAAQAAKA